MNKISISELIKKVNLVKNNISKNDYRAKNKALSKGKTLLRRDIQNDYNFRAKDINQSITLKKAHLNNFQGAIKVSGYAIQITGNLIKTTFASFKKNKKIQVRIKKKYIKSIGAKSKRKPFLIKVNGKLALVERKSNKSYPMRNLATASIARISSVEDRKAKVIKYVISEYHKEYDRLRSLDGDF